MCVYKNQQILS